MAHTHTNTVYGHVNMHAEQTVQVHMYLLIYKEVSI